MDPVESKYTIICLLVVGMVLLNLLPSLLPIVSNHFTACLNSSNRVNEKAGEKVRNGRKKYNETDINQNGISAEKKYILTTVGEGRLGNQMFRYAVLLTLTRNTSLWYVCMDINGYRMLIEVFNKSLSIPVCASLPKETVHVESDSLINLPKANITLQGYFQSHTYFTTVKKALRREFSFPDEVREEVNQYFKNITPPEWVNETFIRVGIHVRRGDMITKVRIEMGVIPTPPEYYEHAMAYFRGRYGRVQFIVTSQDVKWCERNIQGEHIVYSQHSYKLDFVILAMSDHIIISLGTFSWWAGWLCNGTTIYYGVPPPEGTYMAQLKADGKWIPPDDEFNKWLPII